MAVAREKARAAFELLGRPVLVEDTSLELAALGGFPGPLIRWLLEAAGPAAIARMLDGFADRGARARCAAVAWDGAREWLGVGEVAGTIAREPAGASGFGWDVVFLPEWGGGRSYAEMAPRREERALPPLPRARRPPPRADRPLSPAGGAGRPAGGRYGRVGRAATSGPRHTDLPSVVEESLSLRAPPVAGRSSPVDFDEIASRTAVTEPRDCRGPFGASQ